MATYKSKDFTNVKPAFGHESDGLYKASFTKSLMFIPYESYQNITLAIDE